MHLQTVLALSAILLCDAKLPKLNQHIFPNELSLKLEQNSQGFINIKNEKTSRIVDQYKVRHRREVFDSNAFESRLNWTHIESLDENGDFVLKWISSNSGVTFRLEAKTTGYVGLGLNSASNMRGADLVVAWVDDRNERAQILDCHGLHHDGEVVADEVQNYELISGHQNRTHTVVEFRRPFNTNDKEDYIINDHTIQVLWALGPPGSDGELPKHVKSGSKPLRLIQALSKPETIPLMHWDVALKNITIPNYQATLFWCKIIKVPDLPTKHHIVGYQPLIDSKPIRDGKPVNEKISSPVHHMVLYECADDPDTYTWNVWAQDNGSFGPNRPIEWAICATPIAAWAMGSKGEFLPENVGIPLGGRGAVQYYMLEIHYDNNALHEVLDNSGIRVLYTPVLRQHDGALLGAGIGVSALHLIPPKQPQYRTVGICSSECTSSIMPETGINIVSVLLHAHGTARKIALRHVRDSTELPIISEESAYDARYQQSRVVPGGRKFMKGDILITECTYDTTSRDKPILGGYSTSQEMCLSFVLYYPRTELAGCYSMTPVEEFFETFGVTEFYYLSMTSIQNVFLSSGSLENLTIPVEMEMRLAAQEETRIFQGDDQGVSFLESLVIKNPTEFRNKTFMAHLNEMQWSEPLLTSQIERRLTDKGFHMMFCKKRDDTWAVPIQIQEYPLYKELTNGISIAEKNYKGVKLPSVTPAAGSAVSVRHFDVAAILFLVISIIVAR
ncbi:MOXD1 homolog 1 [Amyelois transitella]|uniref:MOXD1 homolog 1 n=1 Tax=Amyelois transitella TaxID=680683 RepID=UPI00298F57E9|nr:MOXD1 homolog 1 [Amyelois transitella]